MLKIDSQHNENFKKYLSLTGSKGLKKEKLFLLSGEKLIREFLVKPHLKIVAEILTSKLEPVVASSTQTSEHTVLLLSADLFNQIDILGTHYNILVLEQPSLEYLNAEQICGHKPNGIEVVMPIGDPGNLGALVRSCEAFGVSRVFLTEEASHPFLPKSVKASAGSVLRIPITFGPSLRDFPSDCIALDAQGVSLKDFVWPSSALLVVGEEGCGFAGMHKQPGFKYSISIPTQRVESLNVVVAASIALAHKTMTS